MSRFILASLIAALPAVAAADFTPPKGCTAYMTVQGKQCQVTHYYICDQDPEGFQWRADLDQDGPYFLSQIDRETQWILSIDLAQGSQERLALGAVDPASFTELSENGVDTFDFTIIKDNGEETRVKGFDRLTGEELVINGITLLETANEVEAHGADGEFKWGAKGNEYISPAHRVFLSGSGTWRTPDGEIDIDDGPMEILLPGDKGFLSEKAKFGCNVIDASFGDTH